MASSAERPDFGHPRVHDQPPVHGGVVRPRRPVLGGGDLGSAGGGRWLNGGLTDRLQFALVRLLLILCRLLPMWLLLALASVLASGAYWLMPRRRRLADDNVRQALGDEGARRIARSERVLLRPDLDARGGQAASPPARP